MQQSSLELISHGAEAKVYKKNNGQNQATIIKLRVPKKYRHPDLDRKINQSRIKSESKIIQKLSKKGFQVPFLIAVTPEQYKIEMQYINGKKLKDYLNSDIPKEQIQETLQKMGVLLKKLHSFGIIHGDLTTSNIMIIPGNELYLIDFGLSYIKESSEDRAVDLYVLERAFKSTHPQLQDIFDETLISYGEQSVLKKLEVVRTRGRKKVAFG